MRARNLVPVVMVMLVGLASTALADPPIAADPSLTDPATLRLQFAPGTTDDYHIEMVQNMSMGGAAMGMAADTVMNMTMDVTQSVEGVDDSGNGTLLQTFTNAEVTATMNGQPMPIGDLGSMLTGLALRVQVTPQGQVLDTQVEGATDPMMQQMSSMVEQSMGQMPVQFPEGPVNIGDTWTQEVPLGLDQMGMDLDTSATSTNTFLGWANVDGLNCALIQSDVTVSLSGTFTEQGMETTATGTGTGTGYTYFDNAAGKVIRATMDLTMNTNISVSGMEMDQSINMTMNMTKQ